MKQDIEAGRLITIPDEDVTIGSWTGTGYISLDKNTGAGAYMISGILNGGSHPVIATGLVTLGMVLNILSSQYLLSAISLITVPTLLKLAGIALFMQGIYYIHMLLIAYVDYLATNDMTYLNQMCDWLVKSAFWSIVQSCFAYIIYCEEAYRAYEEKMEATYPEAESGSGVTAEKMQKPNIDLKISDGQFGVKWGKHKEDYTFLNTYDDYKKMINDIFNNPDKIVIDEAHGEYLYIRDGDLLRLSLDGDFVSLYPGANTGRVLNAIQNGGVIWEKH